MEWALMIEFLLLPWALKRDGRQNGGGDISGKYGMLSTEKLKC